MELAVLTEIPNDPVARENSVNGGSVVRLQNDGQFWPKPTDEIIDARPLDSIDIAANGVAKAAVGLARSAEAKSAVKSGGA